MKFCRAGFLFRVVLGYVGAAATKSVILGLVVLATSWLLIRYASRTRSG